METKETFAGLLREGDRILSFDVRGGYRHFSLHEDMRDFFLFKYDRCYFRYKDYLSDGEGGRLGS